MGDPTQKGNGLTPELLEKMKRPVGLFLIQWDPNTGQLGFRSEGLLPVEEVGLLQWMINLRMGAHLGTLPNKQVQIATPGEVPPLPPGKGN
jgi:hypothetical protein